jgi:hypothetical protein
MGIDAGEDAFMHQQEAGDIYFKVGAAEMLTINSTGVSVNRPGGALAKEFEVVGSADIGADANKQSRIGHAAIGYVSGWVDTATFSHIDQTSTTGAALRQDTLGSTWLQAANTQSLYFLNQNVTKATLTGTDWKFDVPVGIGAAAPSGRLLQVYDTASAAAQVGFTNTTTGNTLTDGLVVGIAADEVGYVWHYDAEDLVLGTSNTDRLHITAAGLVGIGMTPTTQKLEVSTSGIRAGYDAQYTSYFGRAAIGVISGINDYAYFGHLDNQTAGNYGFLQYGDGTTYVNAATGKSINFRINNSTTNQAYFNATGFSVGIGATAYQLHIHEASSGSSYSHFTNTTTGTTSINGLLVGIASDEDAYFYNCSNTDIHLATNSTVRLTVLAAGRTDLNADSIRVITSQSPASGGTGVAGEWAWDSSYFYVCTATNTWKRVALTGG